MTVETSSVSPESQKASLTYAQLMDLARDLQEKYPEAMNILDITGVSPFGSKEMTNPYTMALDTEDFSNVGRHCVAVAFAAGKIADMLGVTGDQKDQIVQAALLHDGDKRLEVMRKKAKNAGVSIDVYGEEWYRTIESVFSDAWVDPTTLETIKSLGWMTGHNSLKKFVTVQDGSVMVNPERSVTEMIVHIADDMTHSSPGESGEVTTYVDFEIRAALSKFSEKYGFLWKEWFAVSQSSWIEPVWNIESYVSHGGWERLENFYDWQKIVFELVCRDLQKQIDPSNQENPVQFIVGLVNRKEAPSLVIDTASLVHGLSANN